MTINALICAGDDDPYDLADDIVLHYIPVSWKKNWRISRSQTSAAHFCRLIRMTEDQFSKLSYWAGREKSALSKTDKLQPIQGGIITSVEKYHELIYDHYTALFGLVDGYDMPSITLSLY